MKNWLLLRLQEQGTWRGLLLLVPAVLGITIAPEYQDQLVSIGCLLAGGHNIITKG